MNQPPEPGSIVIQGATGINADIVNGIYELTTEVSDGLPVLQKKDNHGIRLEYFEYRWWILLRSTFGHAGRREGSIQYAYIDAGYPCLPQSCEVGMWRPDMGVGGGGWIIVPSLTVTLLSPLPSDVQDIVQQAQLAHATEVT